MKKCVWAMALLLSACGSAPQNGSDTSGLPGVESATAGGASLPAGWKPTDACATVDKAMMAKIVGAPVSDASVGLVHEADGVEAATSECSYTLENGSRASLMLRWSPIADNTPAAIAITRNGLEQTISAFGGSVETVDGLGKAAFWVGKIDALNVFIGDAGFAIITLPSSPDSKKQAITLARQLGA